MEARIYRGVRHGTAIAVRRLVRGERQIHGPEVAIVAANVDTLGGLEAYLRGAGVTVHAIVPLFRSIAFNVPQGGFTAGRPSGSRNRL